MKLTTIGIDLAKNVLQVHGADAKGKAVLNKQLKRAQGLAFFATGTPWRIGMQALWQRTRLGKKASGART